MNIVKSILTQNPCYRAGKRIAVKGIMLHSVGVPQPSAEVFIKSWNKESFTRACVHGFIEANGNVYQTLPWEYRGWHCGGSGNDTHIGIEMCEPSTIKYTGGTSWVETGDGNATKKHVMSTYDAAASLFAELCKEYGLNPLGDGVILSHSEGYKRKIASNHGDVEHIWSHFGLSMDGFRQEVNKRMKELDVSTAPEELNNKSETGNALYKVQIGAFEKKENAVSLLERAKKAGFDGFIYREGEEAIINASDTQQEIRVGSIVRVKAGAKTYTGGNLASFVYRRNHKVTEIKNDRAVIAFNGVVVAAVRLRDLTLVK